MTKLPFTALAAISVLALAVPAHALTPKEIVERHTSAGGDIDKIMADYADDAVVMQEGRAIQGKAAIRVLFERMFPKPDPDAPARKAPAGGGMNITKVWQEGDVGFMTWEMGPMKATEEFLVRDGKILVQTIFMKRDTAPAG